MSSTLDLIDAAIADLEAKLNLPPGGVLKFEKSLPPEKNKQKPKNENKANNKNDNAKKGKKNKNKDNNVSKKPVPANNDQPDICKLEFKVGVITKVWLHPDADKLYCEEIDCGEEKPRQIASGLRPHYTLEEMQGRRLLVVSNLKTKKLVGFPSSGMVLCAAETKEDGSEKVEFIEPPAEAPLGEVITFENLPKPEPFTGGQVEKKKIFQACAEGMKTTEGGLAAWNGHIFMTSAGPCKSSTIKNGVMR
mmetsp:Transcript_16881/g.19512  ORF Transcript_16881/g.19512 Transcript_16881/m.19512 type:complete len:249 (-) Transcript_16881:64-810(-)